MKAHKKAKQNSFLYDSQTHSKPNTPKVTINPQNEHRKLLQYKDYLFSLRKIDLAALIQQNNSRKTSNQLKPSIPIKPHKSTFIPKHQSSSQTCHPHAQSQIHKKNTQPIKSKIKQINLKIDKPLNIVKQHQSQNQQKSPLQPTQPKPNSFHLILKKDVHQDDLYCNEDMQQIMNNPHPSTPKLTHINNFCKHQTYRDYSTHRSKNRDLSMPSIEQRNLSEQSEENLDKNGKFSTRSISQGITNRKHNSCSYTTPLNGQKLTGKRHSIKRNSQLFDNSLKSKPEPKEEINKTFDNSQLFSTNDFSAYSKGDNEFEANKMGRLDVKITPFDYQPDFFHIKQKRNFLTNPLNDPQILHSSQSKQPYKLSLNVSEIVKRINNRQSKSSMSDRSYRKKHQNRQINNTIKTSRQSHEKIYSDMMKQKFTEYLSNQSTLPLKQIHLTQQNSKQKSFKTQVKEFRQKHFLMLNLLKS